MGVFRGKGIEDVAASQTSGEPQDPERKAVTQIVTTPVAAGAWRVGGVGAVPITPQPGLGDRTTGDVDPGEGDDAAAAADSGGDSSEAAEPDEVTAAVQQWFERRRDAHPDR